MKPTKADQIFEVAVDGLVQELDLDFEAPHKFVCCFACDVNGEPVVVSSGTVVYEVTTETNPSAWVDIEANNDMTAPVDSSFQAPANKLRVTITSADVAMAYYRIKAVQYYA